MDALELPLVEGADDGLIYLLMPGFESSDYQGIQYQVFRDQGILSVYCYESGFDEEGDCDGVMFPVALNEHGMTLVDSLEVLRVVDPESPDDDIPDEDRERIKDRFESFKGPG